MSQSSFPNFTPAISFTSPFDTISLLLGSIATEELALSHIMNAEAEKVQFVIGSLTTGISLGPTTSVENILLINSSVRRTLQDVIKKEMLLEFKFENILDLLAAVTTAISPFPIP